MGIDIRIVEWTIGVTTEQAAIQIKELIAKDFKISASGTAAHGNLAVAWILFVRN